MAAVSELSPVVGVQGACAVLGLPRASYFRQQRPLFGPSQKAVSARALSLPERGTAREHVESVVSAVAVLGETLRALSAGGDSSAVASVLQEGVANLQQALESPLEEIHTDRKSTRLN